MALIGYARVSTIDQNIDRQIDALHEAGVDKIFEEKVSGKNIQDRTELQKMMNYIRDDDTVVVMALDRLSRDYDDVRIIINQIKDKGASLRILGMPDFSTMPSPFDKMMLDIIIALYSGIAENERNKILERQAQGIAIAKRKGAYKGKRTEYAADAVNPQKRAIYHRIVEMIDDGETAYRISKETGVNRRTIQRIAAELDEAE